MFKFKIAAAQVASVRGDLAGNIQTHVSAILSAAEQGISVLVFPELSLIGYEPDLAADLAITRADECLVPIATQARRYEMAVVVGAPLKNAGTKPGLGAILFGADGLVRTYSKMHLGGAEPNHFTPGGEPLAFAVGRESVGIAICADSSKPSHPEAYAEGGSTIYATGVFLNAEWYATDVPRLAEYANRFQMLVVMANHADSVGTYVSVGKSAVWAPGGGLLAEAASSESSLVVATRTREGWFGEVVRI
jgi:predicted amidohydrolase